MLLQTEFLNDRGSGMLLLTGNSHPHLAKLVAEQLEIRLADAIVYNKPNKETQVEIRQSVRNKHVFILQSASKNVNNDIWEMLILIYTCHTSSAKSITVIMPYLPYSSQCGVSRRSAIPMKLIADMMCKAGTTRLVSLDLCRREIRGFFGVPVDHLRATSFLIQYIHESLPDYKNAVVVAKSAKGMQAATSFAERLRLNIAVIHGVAEEFGKRSIDKPSLPDESELLESTTRATTNYEMFPPHAPKQKLPLTVVGDVGGKIAIIVDDIIDEAKTYVTAAKVLKQRGAYKIYVVATHGLLSGDAPAELEESVIDQVFVTNTVPHEIQKLQCHKIRTVDISLLISDTIRRIYNNERMPELFK